MTECDDFIIGMVKGDKGDKGDTGSQGPQGVQGIQGPSGDAFAIYKTYATISAMEADASNVPEGKFVMISSTVEDPDNAKVYVKNSQGSFTFMVDMSGATGIQGPQGEQGVQGLQGISVSSIAKTGTSGLIDTYTITYSNGNTTTFTVTNGQDGTTIDIATNWGSTLSDTKVPSEKLTKNTLNTKLDANQGSGNVGKYLKVDTDGSVIPSTGGGTTVEDNLTSQSTTNALSANQGRVLNTNKINTSDIADNLTTNDATKVLSAKQGKLLKDLIGQAITRITGE